MHIAHNLLFEITASFECHNPPGSNGCRVPCNRVSARSFLLVPQAKAAKSRQLHGFIAFQRTAKLVQKTFQQRSSLLFVESGLTQVVS